MFEWLHTLESIKGFGHSWFTTVLDLMVVFVLIYEILKLIRDTRAVQMVAGIALFAGLYILSRFLNLEILQFVLRNSLFYAGFAVIVLFQSEIRAALTHFGKNVRNPFSFRANRERAPVDTFDEVILATTTFSAQKIGALIVFERTVGLQNYINRGVQMDAVLSYDLLVNIFNTNAPLHDGAVIIRNRRIAAASCFLPLTLNPRLSKDLGTRHRAAIGITEESDAFVVVVSEETGIISLVEQGKITRNLDSRRLRLALSQAMSLTQPPPPVKPRRRMSDDMSLTPERMDNSLTETSAIDASASDSSITPPAGTPVLIGSGGGSRERLRESGAINFEVFRQSTLPVFKNAKEFSRNVFFRNGRLKVMAGVFTLALWLSVTTQQDAATLIVRGVQVTYQGLSPTLTISNREAVEEVTLRIRGPKDIVERLRPDSFSVTVPLDGKGPGDRVIRLGDTAGDATIKRPETIEITEINPSRLSLRLEQVVERVIPVQPGFLGDLATDYSLAGTTVLPRMVTLRGPESLMNTLSAVATETIWLNAAQRPFTGRYKLNVDPRIEILAPANQEVEVRVNIQPIKIKRRIEGVALRGGSPFEEKSRFTPLSVTVEIEGLKSIVEKLTPDDILVVPEAPVAGTKDQFEVRATVINVPADKYTVTAITPTTVRRLP